MRNFLLNSPFIALAVGLGIAIAVVAWFLFDLRRRWDAVFGKQAKTSSEAVQEVMQRLLQAEERLGALEPRVKTVERIGNTAVQKIGFLRFNPFAHTGGDQSFAVALLDRDNNGIIISSLYTREGVRVYAKDVAHGASVHPLSDEEKTVLEQAMEGRSA